MKLDTELKPGDIVLLKGLGCVLIVVLFMQLLIFPGLNKHEDLSASLEAKTAQKQEMEDAIANMPAVEETIAKQEETLKAAQDQYYGLMENQEIDELVTGVVLNHSLFPVSLSIAETRDAVPDAYFLSERAVAADAAENRSGHSRSGAGRWGGQRGQRGHSDAGVRTVRTHHRREPDRAGKRGYDSQLLK